MAVETANLLLALNLLQKPNLLQQVNTFLVPTQVIPPIPPVLPIVVTSSDVELVTNENYDLGAVLLNLPNGNILNLYGAGTTGSMWGVVAMQQSSDGGNTWTPYAGAVQGTTTNPYNVQGIFYSGLTGAGTGLESWNTTGLVTPAGSVIIFWQTDTGSNPYNFLGYYSRSTDNGVTWSAAAALP